MPSGTCEGAKMPLLDNRVRGGCVETDGEKTDWIRYSGHGPHGFSTDDVRQATYHDRRAPTLPTELLSLWCNISRHHHSSDPHASSQPEPRQPHGVVRWIPIPISVDFSLSTILARLAGRTDVAESEDCSFDKKTYRFTLRRAARNMTNLHAISIPWIEPSGWNYTVNRPFFPGIHLRLARG